MATLVWSKVIDGQHHLGLEFDNFIFPREYLHSLDLQSGQDLNGKDGILTPLIKQLTEAALKAELKQHLEHDQSANRRNGSSTKTVKLPSGSFELNTPRYLTGSFEPKLNKKKQNKCA